MQPGSWIADRVRNDSWTHDITNIGSYEMIVMLWANEVFAVKRVQPTKARRIHRRMVMVKLFAAYYALFGGSNCRTPMSGCDSN